CYYFHAVEVTYDGDDICMDNGDDICCYYFHAVEVTYDGDDICMDNGDDICMDNGDEQDGDTHDVDA
nr:hypothetical protein [Tanacetum cinerariifolium]